jgi:hypothetical protein
MVGNKKPYAESPPLYIDSNEEAKHHFSLDARKYGFDAKVEALPCDFQFVVMGKLWSIERKRVPGDIESSMHDGRLGLQAQRFSISEDEQGILLLEGPLSVLTPDRKKGVLSALFEVQAGGVFVDYCDIGGVLPHLRDLYEFLDKDDHHLMRRPKIEMPSLFNYTDRDMQRRVKTLMTFTGLGESAAVKALRLHTLGELIDNPLLFREIDGVNWGTIRSMYKHLQIDMPDEVPQDKKKVSDGRPKGVRGRSVSVRDALVTDEDVIALERAAR